MKIVFLKDIPRIGQRGQVKEVAPGYANSLFAQGLADRATPQIIEKLSKKKEEESIKKENEKKNFKTFLEKIKSISIVVKSKSNEKGHLFKAIHNDDILKEFKNLNLDINPSYLEVGHIKEIGEHIIILNDGNHKGEVKILVEAI